MAGIQLSCFMQKMLVVTSCWARDKHVLFDRCGEQVDVGERERGGGGERRFIQNILSSLIVIVISCSGVATAFIITSCDCRNVLYFGELSATMSAKVQIIYD